MALKWGVAGSGRIAHDFVTATQTYPKSDHVFAAVAARSKASAEKFAKEHSIPKAYEGYLSLAEDSEVEIVYVGLVTIMHYETTKLMLEHGKHVLCEKPITFTEKQTKKLYEIAKAKNLFLLEGIWSRFFPAVHEMKHLIDTGAIGDVNHLSVHYGYALQNEQSYLHKELRGCVILDLAIYILQLQQYIFRGLKPTKITVNGHFNEVGLNESCGIIITYPGRKIAVISASARVNLRNEAAMVGTTGTLVLPDFWCPEKLILSDGTVKDFPLPVSSVPFTYYHSGGLRYEAEEARLCIKHGKIESPHFPHAESIELAQLMDHIRNEMNIVFPEDSQEF